MFNLKITILVLCLVLQTNCIYRYRYVKDYNPGQIYEVMPGEEILKFSYVRGRKLESGIFHTMRVFRKTVLQLAEYDGRKAVITYEREIEEGEVNGGISRYEIDFKNLPSLKEGSQEKKYSFYGFTFGLDHQDKTLLKVRILEEPDIIYDQPTIFMQDEDLVKKDKNRKGLAY